MVIVGFIVINQFVVWFLRVDYLHALDSTSSYISRSGSKFSVISPYSLGGKGGPLLRSRSAVVFFGNSLDSVVVSSIFLSTSSICLDA
ncbi:hypothetical protein BSPWISOXPB_820 [uncultured Gammaproteobacteria bacterium]|nr:hypothetical protein BSPWISOXPB_820 [uncultured Gammaproteobacteria bacterium]